MSYLNSVLEGENSDFTIDMHFFIGIIYAEFFIS